MSWTHCRIQSDNIYQSITSLTPLIAKRSLRHHAGSLLVLPPTTNRTWYLALHMCSLMNYELSPTPNFHIPCCVLVEINGLQKWWKEDNSSSNKRLCRVNISVLVPVEISGLSSKLPARSPGDHVHLMPFVSFPASEWKCSCTVYLC